MPVVCDVKRQTCGSSRHGECFVAHFGRRVVLVERALNRHRAETGEGQRQGVRKVDVVVAPEELSAARSHFCEARAEVPVVCDVKRQTCGSSRQNFVAHFGRRVVLVERALTLHRDGLLLLDILHVPLVVVLLLRPANELGLDFVQGHVLPVLHLRLHRLPLKRPTLPAARSRAINPAAEEALKPLTALFRRLDLLHGRIFQLGLFQLLHRLRARGRGLRRGLLVHGRYLRYL